MIRMLPSVEGNHRVPYGKRDCEKKSVKIAFYDKIKLS